MQPPPTPPPKEDDRRIRMHGQRYPRERTNTLLGLADIIHSVHEPRTARAHPRQVFLSVSPLSKRTPYVNTRPYLEQANAISIYIYMLLSLAPPCLEYREQRSEAPRQIFIVCGSTRFDRDLRIQEEFGDLGFVSLWCVYWRCAFGIIV